MASSDAEKSLSPIKQMASSDTEMSSKKQKVEERGDDEEHENKCPICWSALSIRSSTMLGCKHIFHLDCIGSEFNIMGCMQCPTCKQVDAGGNWRFWDNRLPASAALRRTANPNARLVQSGSYMSLQNFYSRNRAMHSLQPGLSSNADDPFEWMMNTIGNEFSLVDPSHLDANVSEQGRAVRFVSSLDCMAAVHGVDRNTLDGLFSHFDTNHTAFRRGGNRIHQRRSRAVVPTQEGGQHAANLIGATGPALNARVRQETAETQGAARANHGAPIMHNPVTIGYEMQAMSMSQPDIDEEGAALEARGRHGRQEMSASPHKPEADRGSGER